MSDFQIRDVSEAVLVSMTEEEMANWRRQEGAHVVCHRDRYWEEVRPGFYQPIHWLARLSAHEATRPELLCWGFRAALCECDEVSANGSMPIHLLSNLESYALEKFSKNRRKHLRKGLSRVRIVELLSPALLQEQGYEVLISSVKRTGYGKLPLREEYIAGLKDYMTPGRKLVLAGLIDGKLGGYLTGYAVNGTAYMEDRIIATEALSSDISSGLLFEFVQLCRRSGEIRELVSGQHSREDLGLCTFKQRMGFPVIHIPAKVSVNPIIGNFLRWRYPHKYYRLTGRD
jgi:hypothetical protein